MKVIHITNPTEADYNSCDHKDLSKPPKPSTKPVQFGRWIAFLHPGANYRVIELNAHETALLRGINTSAILTGALSAAQLDDLQDFGIDQRIQRAIDDLASPIFARFDECSPKDGLHKRFPLHDARMVLEQISTAPRTASAIEKMETWMREEEKTLRCPLYLLRYDSQMDVNREFRCFCYRGNLTGISQYEWHTFSYDWTAAATCIWRCAEKVLQQILDYNERLNDDCVGMLKEDGFVFDILVKGPNVPEEVEEIQVVELNSFGPNSNCGSGLFHWLRDWEVLSGAAEPEMRILRKGDSAAQKFQQPR